MTHTRAILPDELRRRMVGVVMMRDRLSNEQASRIVNDMSIAALTQLELETREREQRTAFTSEYDPYAR